MVVNNNSIKCEFTVLTDREAQVLSLICEGYTIKQVGCKLYLSPYTIVSHKKKLLQKFKAKNSVHLGVLAERHGYLRKDAND